MTCQLMWHNVRTAALNATLQLLVIKLMKLHHRRVIIISFSFYFFKCQDIVLVKCSSFVGQVTTFLWDL